MSSPRRSQSALEYMMTYGWAILVIVIVAGVLYSLGIFSPSSAISSTVTGFSNLGSVTAQCIGNQGLTIQLGDSVGYTIQITNISVSASGKTVSMPEQATIAPSGTKVFYISNVCPSPSSRYSLSVTVYYTEPGQIFPGPYTSTGTITGSSSKQQISSTPAFDQAIPLTITNSQDNSTPNPYQQMVIVPSSVYGGYAAPNFQNVEFFYSNGSIVPSWLQNYTSTNATWWLKLSSISASSSKTVYMGFVPKSTSLFNTANDGEAPQLSSTYAEYDDGANVFVHYFNFAGTALPSGLSESGVTYTVSNGLNITAFASNSAYIEISGTTFSPPIIFEVYGNPWYAGTAGGYEIGGIINPGTTNVNVASIVSYGGDPGIYGQQSNSAGSSVITSNLVTSQTTGIWSSNIISSTSSSYQLNHGFALSLTTDAPTYSLPAGFGAGGALSGLTGTITWYRVRTYPPNGIMPSVSFGYPSNITKPANIQSYAPLTISNNQNVSVSNFQQMVNVPSSVFTGYANTASGAAFQNVEFFYANGTVIPSWLENYTSSNALYWIKLPSVPAATSFTVYLGFAPTSTNLFNTNNIGEAPQLSSTYAEYDDGANVFTNYWNFAGTTLPSGWTQVGTGYSINNGFEFQSPGTASNNNYIESTSTFSQGIITEAYIYPTNLGWVGFSQFGTYSSGGVLFYYYPGQNGWEVYNGNQLHYTGNDAENTYYILSAITPGSRYAYLAVNYQILILSSSGYIANSNGNLYVGDGGGTGTMYWLRVRAYPPNGVMPSVSFGSVS